MSFTISNDVFSAQTECSLTNFQLKSSSLVQNFCSEAIAWAPLCGMMLGRIAAPLVRFRSAQLFNSFGFNQTFSRFTSWGIGVSAEGTIMAAAPGVLMGQGLSPDLWRGSVHGTFTMMMAQGVARGIPMNGIIREVSQDLSFVAVNVVCGVAGITDQVHGSFMEQYCEARIVSVRMNISGRLVHSTCMEATYTQATYEVQRKVVEPGSQGPKRENLSPLLELAANNGMRVKEIDTDWETSTEEILRKSSTCYMEKLGESVFPKNPEYEISRQLIEISTQEGRSLRLYIDQTEMKGLPDERKTTASWEKLLMSSGKDALEAGDQVVRSIQGLSGKLRITLTPIRDSEESLTRTVDVSIAEVRETSPEEVVPPTREVNAPLKIQEGEDEIYNAQRTRMNSLGRGSSVKSNLKTLIKEVGGKSKFNPIEDLPNGAHLRLRALGGVFLQRSIYPLIREWNEKYDYPLAHLIAPNQLEIVPNLRNIHMPKYQGYPHIVGPIDSLIASMHDIFVYHLNQWEQRINRGETTPDYPEEIDQYEHFKEVAKMNYSGGREVLSEATQTPKGFIYENMIVGTSLIWAIIHLIPDIHHLQFGRQANRTELFEEVSGVDDLYMDLVRLPVSVIWALEQVFYQPAKEEGRFTQLVRSVQKMRWILPRYILDPRDFRFYQTKDGLKLYLEEDLFNWFAEEMVPSVEQRLFSKTSSHTGCVGLSAQSGNQSIIRNLLDWKKRWSIRHYIPTIDVELEK